MAVWFVSLAALHGLALAERPSIVDPEPSEGGKANSGLDYDELTKAINSQKSTVEQLPGKIGGLKAPSDKSSETANIYADMLKKLDAALHAQRESTMGLRNVVKSTEGKHMNDVRTALGSNASSHAAAIASHQEQTAGPVTQEELRQVAKPQKKSEKAPPAQPTEIKKLVMEQIQDHGKASNPSDHTYNANAFRVSLAWDSDVDVDLRLDIPKPQCDADVVNYKRMNACDFSLDVDDRGKAGKKHVESISRDAGKALPDGQYKAVAKYYAGATPVEIEAELYLSNDEDNPNTFGPVTLNRMGDVESLFEFSAAGGKVTLSS
jgi:ribosomal protein L12E/L44/L45/RPP1/RPP2